MNYKFALILALIVSLQSCKNPENSVNTITQPTVEKKPHTLEKHGDNRNDPYYWLNDRENPEVISYLESENKYADTILAPTKQFQEDLFNEMKGRIKEDDNSVPYKFNGYWYITRYEEGKDYPIYTRKKGSLDADEEILINVNELAQGQSYCNVIGLNVSPDNQLLAYGIDTTGRRKYTIYIKNLMTGKLLKDKIENVTGGSTWANDNKTLYYTSRDDVTLRSDKIFKHTLGDHYDKDKLVYHEKDETFNTYVYKSKSRKYIIIGSASTLTSEYRFLDADQPDGEFKIVQERTRGLEYDIAHYKDHFYILTNTGGATNFKLVKASVDHPQKENWQDLIPHREDVLIEGVDIFKDYLVLSERDNGLNKIRIIKWDNTDDYYLPFDNETYLASTNRNVEFNTHELRYVYSSLTTPASIIDFNMNTKTKIIQKEQEVLDDNFDKSNYVSERIWATADDGVKVPISLVYNKNFKKGAQRPLLIYAYGSYGSTSDPYFSSTRLSLLDRGFVFAIAHVRGGEYLGREWYENGKLLKKKNTFTDFISCSEHLIEQGYTSPDHLYALGGSAGGLLMGAIVNMKPELYNGVIAAVPFVDVVTTMLDDSIPLTTGEYDEWGNPNDKQYYDYMKSYSPYDNVTAQEYPNMLVTTGLHDSQVQYWEPAKWVAKLRETKTGDNILLLRTNMDAGHGGASGRFESLKETAEEYAFILHLEDIKD